MATPWRHRASTDRNRGPTGHFARGRIDDKYRSGARRQDKALAGQEAETQRKGPAKAGPGTVGFGVYNVWNTEYKTVYSQAAEAVYGAISSLPAQGRTYGLSYTLKY